MPRIIEFQGRRIEVPDAATDEQIAEILTTPADAPAQAAPAAAPVAAPAVAAAPEDVRGASGIPGGDVQSAAPVAQREQSIIDTIMSGLDYADDTAAIGLTGARRGVSAVLGLPVDLVNAAPMAANILPGVDGVGPISDAPIGGSRFVDAILGAPADIGAAVYNEAADAVGSDSRMAGAEGPQPQDMFQRGAGRIGQELGAAAVPVGGVLAKAARTTIPEARAMSGPIGRMVESAAVNPGRFVQKEAAVASGAGTGAAVANEVTRSSGGDPNSPRGQVADLVGALAGASTVGIGGVLANGLGQTFNALRQNPNYVDQVVKDAVVERVGQAANLPGAEVPGGAFDTQSLVDAIMGGSGRPRPSEVIPGYADSLADRTGNPGIASLEYGRAAGPSSGAYTQRRSANTEAVDQAMSTIEPQATPGMLRDELVVERDRRLMDAIMGQEQAAEAAAQAASRVTPTTTPAQRGGAVREGLETARDAARARTEEAYAQANVAGQQVDPAPLAQAIDQTVAGLTEVERGLVPQGVIDRVRSLGAPLEDGPQPTGILGPDGSPIMRDPAGPEPVRLKEATDLKSELQRLQRAALADPRQERGGRNAARVLGQMIDSVDGYINSNLTDEQRAALDTARGAKFDEAERFTRQGDPVARALGRYEGGQPQVGDDRVAGLFVDPQSMDRLFAQADTPQVRTAIRDEVLSRGDTSSADRINQFMADYGEQLDRFPGLRDELATAAGARTREAEATAGRTTLERDLGTDERPGRGTVGRYLQYSDANSERAINEVLNSKDPARAADELLTFINDKPAAVEGARSAFWKKLKSESQSTDNAQRSMGGKRQWRGDWLKSWLDDPRTSAVAERLYRDKPEDLEKLRAFADVLDNADLRARGKTAGTSGTAQGVSNILTPETLQSRSYAWMRGQISGTYLATSIAAVVARRAVRGARADAIERLTDKVLLNPDIAMELLKDNNPANRAALARKAKGWLGNEASTLVNLMNEDEDDDTKRKVMEGL